MNQRRSLSPNAVIHKRRWTHPNRVTKWKPFLESQHRRHCMSQSRISKWTPSLELQRRRHSMPQSRIPRWKPFLESQRGHKKAQDNLVQTSVPQLARSVKKDRSQKRSNKPLSSHKPGLESVKRVAKKDKQILDRKDNLNRKDLGQTMNHMRGRSLIKRETQGTKRPKTRFGQTGANQCNAWDFSDPGYQQRMLQKYGYNDNTATWGPSRFAVSSGLEDYRIEFTDKRKGSIVPISPKCMDFRKYSI